jgi:hypothetical protein
MKKVADDGKSRHYSGRYLDDDTVERCPDGD